jgi:hypothetical protein
MSTPFRQHTDVLSKSLATTQGLVGRRRASALVGGFSLVAFSWAIQVKATRAPMAHESSCF